MKVRGTLVCDLIQQVEGGKPNLMGVFDVFNVKEVPTTLPTFYFHMKLEAESNEELVPGVTELKIEFGNEDGVLKDAGGPLPPFDNVEGDVRDIKVTLVAQFHGIEIEKFGKHFLRVSIDGRVVDELGISVVQRAG